MESVLKAVKSNISKIDVSELVRTGGLPSPTDYFYYTGLKEGKLILNEDIDDMSVESVIIPLKMMDEDPDITDITVYLNSNGGNPEVGMSIVSTLENMRTPVTISILGRAASAAGYIAMAKSPNIHTICTPYSVCLIHPGSVFLFGNASEAEDTHDFLRRYDEEIIKNFILSRTKISEEKYEQIKRREYWMLPDEMVELGIVDEII